jgi:photosystem II stability/assembly factor-like uncharacterized protein
MRCGLLHIAFAASLIASSAEANGRFPRAQQLILDPGDPTHLVLRTTFGIVTSRDDGASWSWICEKAVGYGGVEDPAIAVSTGSAILAGHFSGLSRSADRGCNWDIAGGGLAGRRVIDLTVERDAPSHVTVLASVSIDGQSVTELHASTDAGASFKDLGSDLPSGMMGLTLDRAPSQPTRLYLSAVVNDQGEILRSDDDGATFTRIPIPGASSANAPYIAAVDPNDADTLWIRIAGSEEGVLMLSRDAGATFQEVLRAAAELRGFALAPDGKTVFAGFGGGTAAAELGIWTADTDALVFEQVYREPVSCLTYTPSGLYACTGETEGFEVARSTDGGKTFERVLELGGVMGPLACAAEATVADVCGAEWSGVCARLSNCEPTKPADPPGATSPPEEAARGCGVARRSSSSLDSLLLLGVVALLGWARRRH